MLRGDGNNDNFQPPPRPLPQSPQPPRPPQPPRRDDIFQPQAPPPQTPRKNDFFGPGPRIPPSPSALPLPPDDYYFLEKKNLTQNIDENRQSLISELEKIIEKSEKKNEEFEVDTSINSYFNDAEEILDRNYLEKIENEKEELKEIEREYNFSHILEQINDGVTPEEIEFYFGGDNKNFF